MRIRADLEGDGAERPQRAPKFGEASKTNEKQITFFFFGSCCAINVSYKGPTLRAFPLHFLESSCILSHDLKRSVQKCVSFCTSISTVQGLRRYLEWRRRRKKNSLLFLLTAYVSAGKCSRITRKLQVHQRK